MNRIHLIKTLRLSFALSFLCLLVTFFAPGKAIAEYYSYEDRNGTLHFVDDISKIPKEYQQKKQVLKEESDDLTADEREQLLEKERQKRATDRRREDEQQQQNRQRRAEETRREAQEQLRKALTTPVTIRGRQVFVPVRLRNGSAETEAMLLLDTGA